MRIGVDYYPEHWDPALWEKDADLMQKTGVELVRLAEFAWSRLEPEDGVFDFSWLDQAVSILEQRGMSVVLCTPTSCPPLWFYEKYPDSVMVEKDGSRTRTGIRGHRCISHPMVRAYSERIITRMAEHFRGRRIAAWQIDNELEAYHCFCPLCKDRFRAWLKNRYPSLPALNHAWGNSVWSGEYSSWEQVQPENGHYPEAWMNPSLMLEFSRFASDNVIEFVSWQADLIRRACPGVPVTTNVWFSQYMPDFYREFSNLDFISYDNYPPTRLPDDPEACFSHAFHLDLMRGVKKAPFWIMEQLSGGMGCWAPMSRMPQPGMIRGYALQAFAHGADTVSFFRWRTAATGAEMHWHGLLDHSNVPGRRFDEFAGLCREAEGLRKLQGTRICSDVAVLCCFEDEYAFRIQPQTEGYYYLEQLQRLHRAFSSLGLNVDIISRDSDLDGYRIVCAPEMYIASEAVAARLEDFARQGGTVILTTRSGVKNMYNNAVMDLLPGVFRLLAGVHVTEYDPLGRDRVPVEFEDGTRTEAGQWCDLLETDGAHVLARYAGEYFAGTPAVTENRFQDGRVLYIASVGAQALYDHVARHAADQAGLSWIPDLPARVEVTTREGDGFTARFIFNHDAEPHRVNIGGEELLLQPFDMHIQML